MNEELLKHKIHPHEDNLKKWYKTPELLYPDNLLKEIPQGMTLKGPMLLWDVLQP